MASEKIENFHPEKNMILEQGKTYRAKIKTSVGDMLVELHHDHVPVTVNNFVYLGKSGFYNDVIFHRIIDGFMIQGGDPTGTGSGGPGYRFGDEKFIGEYTRGTLAMANAGPNTNGSQFFIMHHDNPLPPNYTIFGNVLEGLDIVDAIATAEVEASMRGESSTPVDPVVISEIEIIEE
jgi:cyclophilin family peptidyl-prolyl cis-trans isomerase